jgi:hypothetical protein
MKNWQPFVVGRFNRPSEPSSKTKHRLFSNRRAGPQRLGDRVIEGFVCGIIAIAAFDDAAVRIRGPIADRVIDALIWGMIVAAVFGAAALIMSMF